MESEDLFLSVDRPGGSQLARIKRKLRNRELLGLEQAMTQEEVRGNRFRR